MENSKKRGGTWIREPDGATMLYYSPFLFNDPPTALRNRRPEDKWYRVEYDILPDWKNINWPDDVESLKPGEWIRVH
ncbi:MAG TPA: hypothetical protein VGE97_09470 [Nitrososphaera sp.]|jgi:hypothetical protein